MFQRGRKISGVDFEKKILILDCQIAGLSGDMILAGLIDLGADFDAIKSKLTDALRLVPDVKNFKFGCKKVVKNGISGTQIFLSFKESVKHRHGKDLNSIMNKMVSYLDWNDSERKLARDILNTLIRAEAKVHESSEEHVHLHEAGSIDTIIDIIGFILACQDLNLFNRCHWISTPVAVGGGRLKFSHGLVSNPAPAVLEILKQRGIEIVGGPVESELTTPTGAAILVNIVKKSVKFYPPISLESIGYGAGTQEFPNIPNVLRIIMGRQTESSPYNFEQIITVETNVDDITGELLGNTINKLMKSGIAKDISVIPVTTKKRPGYLIKILTTYDHLLSIVSFLINELGTLGVRFFPTMRYTLNRKIISIPINIQNQDYNISVKISWDLKNIIIQNKPESDEILQLSQKTGISMRELLKIISAEIEKQFPIGKKLPELKI